MVQAKKQKKVFLSLCGQRDYDLLTGKEAMTQADFERITYITTALGYSSCTQELISEHLELACKEAERTDREFDILKDYPADPSYFSAPPTGHALSEPVLRSAE